jgi:methyl-accepting chemotaxis protein
MGKLWKIVSEISISAKLILLAVAGAVFMVLVAVVVLLISRSELVAERTEKAHAIADSVWAMAEDLRRATEAGSLTVEEAKQRLFAASGAIRFEGGSNYVFIYDSETAICVMNSGNPPMLGKDARQLRDSNGVPFGTLIIDIAKQKGEGVVRYSYPKGVGSVPLEKVVYVRHFAPWRLAIASAEYMEDIDAVFWRMALTAASVIGVLLLASIAIAWAVGRSVVKPLSSLEARMQALGAGDLHASIEGAQRGDEIGEMARAILVLKDAAIAKVRLESEAEAARKAAEETRAAQEAESVEQARQDHFAVEALGRGLVRLAEGDFAQLIETPFAAKTEKLRDDFNSSVDKLKRTMLSLVSSVNAIKLGTREISSASDDLSKRTEQQATSLEQTAAALDEITATVKKSAAGANHAREVVVAADDDAKKGAIIVRQAVDAMGAIAKSAQQISQIIGVIDEIAFQTNLLALNAGVEAARAGDAGKGFAVVASEVRALAQRSAEAAKEIKSLISTSSTQVDRGVELVGETGVSLERIMTQVTKINEVVTGIAAGAKEQAVGLEEVNTAINQMDQVTQQNAAMVEESMAATLSLSQEALRLSELIGQFQVGRTANEASDRETHKSEPQTVRQPTSARTAVTGRRLGVSAA